MKPVGTGRFPDGVAGRDTWETAYGSAVCRAAAMAGFLRPLPTSAMKARVPLSDGHSWNGPDGRRRGILYRRIAMHKNKVEAISVDHGVELKGEAGKRLA
jgi:hypothetical protein